MGVTKVLLKQLLAIPAAASCDAKPGYGRDDIGKDWAAAISAGQQQI